MKGMNKILRGYSFKSILNYCEGRGEKSAPEGRLIGGNMSGRNVRSLLKEFTHFRRQNPEIEKATWHNSLRLPPGDELEDHQWSEIVAEYMKRMGFRENHPYCIWKHDDESAVHIIACRIGLDSGVYLGKNENLISTKIIQQLEKDFNLTQTKGPGYDKDGRLIRRQVAQLSKKELDKAVRTGEEPVKQKLQRLINEAIGDGGVNVIDFIDRLVMAGVDVRANVASTGALSGFSFSLDQLAFKGSELGQSFKWKQLQARGVNYEQARDGQKLQRFRASGRNGPYDGGTPEEPGFIEREAGATEQQSGASGPPVERRTGSSGGYWETSDGHGTVEPGDVEGNQFTTEGSPIVDFGRSANQGVNDDDPQIAHEEFRSDRRTHGNGAGTVENLDTPSPRLAEASSGGERSKSPTPVANGGADVRSIDAPQTQSPGTAMVREVEKLAVSWREQHGALGAAAYVIHLVPARANLSAKSINDGQPLTAAEVEASLREIQHSAARGYMVRVTPQDAGASYFTFEVGEDALRQAQLEACLVMACGDRRQSVVKVSRVGAEEEGAEVDKPLVDQLSTEVHDRTALGEGMWLAGFAGTLRGGVARIISAAGSVCRRSTQLFEMILRRLREDKQRARVRAKEEVERQREEELIRRRMLGAVHDDEVVHADEIPQFAGRSDDATDVVDRPEKVPIPAAASEDESNASRFGRQHRPGS